MHCWHDTFIIARTHESMVMNCHKIWSHIKLVPSHISFHTYFIKFHIPLSLYSFCGSKTADTNELVFTSELTFPVRLDGLIKFSHQRVWLIVYLASLCTHSDINFHNQTSEYCLFLLKSICLIINQNNKPESRLSFWFYKSFQSCMPCWKITWWAWDEKHDITHEALIGPSENKKLHFIGQS